MVHCWLAAAAAAGLMPCCLCKPHFLVRDNSWERTPSPKPSSTNTSRMETENRRQAEKGTMSHTPELKPCVGHALNASRLSIENAYAKITTHHVAHSGMSTRRGPCATAHAQLRTTQTSCKTQSSGMCPPSWSYTLCVRGLISSSMLRTTAAGIAIAVRRKRALNASMDSRAGAFCAAILPSTSSQSEKSKGFRSG